MRRVELKDGRVFRLEPGLEDRVPAPEGAVAWCAVCQRPSPVKRRGEAASGEHAVKRDGKWYCPEHAPAVTRRRRAPRASDAAA